MATPRVGKTSFWSPSKRGPWPDATLARLRIGLDRITRDLRERTEVAAIVLFGSYARGDFARRSDFDLLVLFFGRERPERTRAGKAARQLIGRYESELRLPMHLAPLLASIHDHQLLTPELLHDLWRDGIVLYAHASALALLRPGGMSAWALVRFSIRGTPADRVRLSRRLHGLGGRPGIVQLPGLTLGRGVLLVPASQQEAVRAALDDAGATYDLIPIWRAA